MTRKTWPTATDTEPSIAETVRRTPARDGDDGRGRTCRHRHVRVVRHRHPPRQVPDTHRNSAVKHDADVLCRSVDAGSTPNGDVGCLLHLPDGDVDDGRSVIAHWAVSCVPAPQ